VIALVLAILVQAASGSASTPQAEVGTAFLGGKATWYDDGAGLYAAAGPVLREALGGDPAFRGGRVTVRSGGRSVTVTLSDWCACGERGGVPTLLDLSADAFARLAPLGRGVINVEVELDAAPIRLPATDTDAQSARDILEELKKQEAEDAA
jgi:expansin (peptidoglycan-binding protein)